MLSHADWTQTQVHERNEASWVVQLTAHPDLAIDEISSQELMLEEIARECGGSYDGYVTSVGSP